MFIPPYCPHENCENHRSHDKDVKRWFWKKGSVFSKISGRIRRFQCKECLRIFSERNFSIDYRNRLSIDYQQLMNSVISSSGIRDMARQFNCSPNVIANRISRMAKSVLAFNAFVSEDHIPTENGVYTADGLESFIVSQFFPTNINILAGSQSQFIYDFSFYFFKRKGRTTSKQKRVKEVVYPKIQFEEKAAVRSFTDILNTFAELIEKQKKRASILDTDENRIYETCLKRHKELREKMETGEMEHRKTSSKKGRNYRNKLFPANYIDRQLRKDMAEHLRETVQFGRNSSNAMERFTVYLFWHNYKKPFRINKKGRIYSTHAEAAGIDMKRIEKQMEDVFLIRPDYSFLENKLNSFMKSIWSRTVLSPRAV